MRAAGLPPITFDWSDAKQHWRSKDLPCRHCRNPTRLRDFDGRPAHKVCAEKAAAE